jgi:hypothetical protein
MSTLFEIGIDVVAIVILVFGIYFPRHHRRDLVAAYIGVNIGVLAVSSVLSSSTVSFGLGMGLFGVLSIIRLRSLEIDQQEVAYYFTSLAIALLAGLSPEFSGALLGLIVLLLVGMFIGDHPAIFSDYRQALVNVDRAIADEEELRGHLASLLGADIVRVRTAKLDLVNDSTLVDVRFRIK